jgi:hypothetical protein
MNGNDRNSHDRERLVDTLTAKLTEAAYGVALQHERPNSWIDLELALWRAMGDAVRRWLPRKADRRPVHSEHGEAQRHYASC